MQARRQFSSMQARAGQVQRGLQEPLDRRSNLPQCCAMPAQSFAEMVRRLSIAALSLGLLAHGSDTRLRPAVSPRLAHLPRITVWAWERREDLRELDPQNGRCLPGPDRAGRRARARGAVSPSANAAARGRWPPRIAVVRIETRPGAPANDTAATAVAARQWWRQPANPASPRCRWISTRSVRRAGTPPSSAGSAAGSHRSCPCRSPRSPRGAATTAAGCTCYRSMKWCPCSSAWNPTAAASPSAPACRRRGCRRLHHPRAAVLELRGHLDHGSVAAQPPGKRVYIFPDRGWARDGLAETVRSLP